MNRQAKCALWILITTVVLVLVACDPLGTDETTTTIDQDTTTTTTEATMTTEVELPTDASSTEELQDDLDDGRLVVNDPVVSDGTLKPPAGATIVFGSEGLLVRTIESTGAAVDVNTADVTITNLRVQGSNPEAIRPSKVNGCVYGQVKQI